MRENIFRGKSIKTKEWVEGFYLEVRHHDDASHIHVFIMPPEKCVDTGVPAGEECSLMVEVDPVSVGQYINVRNLPSGRKLFEGDILQYYDDEIQVIRWEDDWNRLMLVSYAVRVKKEGGKFIEEVTKGWNELWDYDLEQMKYLGNIHDNPKMIDEVLNSINERMLRTKKQLEDIYKGRKKQSR